MKAYAYTYTTRRSRTGYTHHTVTLYRVKHNQMCYIDTMTEMFVSEFQLVMMIMAKHKELPKKHLDTYNKRALRELGVANIQRI